MVSCKVMENIPGGEIDTKEWRIQGVEKALQM